MSSAFHSSTHDQHSETGSQPGLEPSPGESATPGQNTAQAPSAVPSTEQVEHEIALEQQHVDRVYEALKLAMASAKEVEREGQNRYKTDRSDFLREEHGTALFERDAFAYQSAKRLAILDAEHEGLVFGRLDLTEDDPRHIGRIGVRDEDYEPLVIDWRAPAAEPFYRATPNEPLGVIRRRVLRCRDDVVIGIEDDLLDSEADSDLVIVGEGALMAALSRARGDAMRDIVATIQGEQDEAIRAPYQGVTVIAGGPGTGKTVVALHRAAYLLYTHRRRLEKGGVLVVGPSPVFMNYIERVLPSLGEDAVTLRDVGSLAADVLGVSSERVDPARVATLKGSLRMLPVLKHLAQLPPGDGEPELRVTVKGEVLGLTSTKAGALRRQVLAHHKVNLARKAAERAVLDTLWERFTNEAELSRDQFDDLVTSQASYAMFLNAWWPNLEAQNTLARLAEPRVVNLVAENLLDEEKALLSSSYQPVAADQQGWTIADIALLDELVALIGPSTPEVEEHTGVIFDGVSEVDELVTTYERMDTARSVDPDDDPQETYAHVLVDEAQDITPMQWRMLRRRGPQASWTIVGDPAQSSYPYPEEAAQALRELIGRAPNRRFRLSTNYRSPAEVFDLAAKVIVRVQPDADLPRAVRRTEVEPALLTTDPEHLAGELVQVVADLSGQVEGTIGVITPPSLLDQVSADLAGVDTEQVRVITPLQAKGLEYDAVVVVSPDDIVEESPGRERVLYVALTRPTQRLVTLDLVPAERARWRRALT